MPSIPRSLKKPTKAAKVEKAKYTCMCCMVEKSEDSFYKSQWTKMWNLSDRRVLFCKDCIDKLMQEYTPRYGEKTALIIALALLDMPYYGATYKGIIESNSIFNVGLYVRMLNGRQYQYQTFANTLVGGELQKTDNEVKEERESRWSKSDKQNMSFVISVVGYDPFDNCGMSEEDRKYCFNMLAGYCDTEGIRDDGHKIQSVIQITQSQLQCRKLDEFINQELLGTHPDESRLKNLSETKTKLLAAIAKIAQDNNISSAYNKVNAAGKNTLSQKMKEMEAAGFESIKVNMFDIQTSDAMKQIADLSNRSILEQLTWDANDYTEMLKDQREMIIKLTEELNQTREELRITKNKILDAEQAKKRK